MIEWQGDYQKLNPVYEPYFVWSNFTKLFTTLPFPSMLMNTLLVVLIGEIGVLVSSILIAYGFSRFPLPGGDLLFYVVIATILIPEKITFIPTFFFYVKVFHWQGTIYPLVVYLFFGSPVYIFLLRQNFKSIPDRNGGSRHAGRGRAAAPVVLDRPAAVLAGGHYDRPAAILLHLE